MNRRTAIKQSALITILGFTDIKSLFAATATATATATADRGKEVRGFHRFMMGKLELTVVTDGHILMKPVQPNFAPGIASAKVEKALTANFASRSEVDLGINILLVRSDDKLIMIDSGCGSNFGKDAGWLIQNLANAGIKAADITDVVISHAHPDHIGGLTDQDGKAVFPNARIYLSRIEHDFWMSPSPDFSKSKLKDEALKKLVVQVARKNILAIRPHLHLVNDGDEILGCIKMQLAAGHTPGHCIVHVFSGAERLCHIADLVHSAVLVVEHPEWGFEGDTDFDLAIKSRKAVMGAMAASRTTIFSYHLPWPGIGHVRRKGEGVEWVQQPSALPYP